MKRRNFIENQDDFPDTHLFSYNGKKYPIKSIYFNLSSKYFSNHLEIFESSKIIPLIKESDDVKIELADEHIEDFIKFVQHKKIDLNNSNVISLNYLSNIYEVETLKSITIKYMNDHQRELIIKILLTHQNDTKFDIIQYETIILQNFAFYIKDENLSKINISILYRIIQKYTTEERTIDEKRELNDFLIKLLRQRGREVSSLFAFFYFDIQSNQYMKQLLTDYSEIIDFHFINSAILKMVYVDQNEELQSEKRKRESLEQEIEKQKQMNEQKNQENSDKLAAIKEKFSKEIEALNEQITKMNAINKEQDLTIQKLTKENNEFKNQLSNLQQKIQQEKEKGQKIEYVTGHEFEGIFHKLNKECGGNAHLKGRINMTSNGDSYHNCYNLIDEHFNSYFYAKENPNSFVEIDFKDKKISISKYSMKSNNFGDSFLINWDIVGSNDRSTWTQIDERHIRPWTGSYNVSTYSTHNESFYKYIRIRLKGKNSSGDDYLVLSSIEFFGTLK